MHHDVRGGLLLALAVCLLSTGPAMAHRINIFASWTGERIEGECYASDGTPAKGQTVLIHGPEGAELGRVTTDDKGRFLFTPPEPVTLRFTLDTADGHHAEFTVPASDMGAGSPPEAAPASSTDEATSARVTPQPSPGANTATAVRKAVAPLERRIDRLETQIRLRDILGGIGYIWGVAGIVLYLRCRRPKG